MIPDLRVLYNSSHLPEVKDGVASAVDIVAVHGLSESLVEAWTDPGTGKLWLKDFLPAHIPTARVLSFGYDASASTFFGEGCLEAIQKHAHTLVQELQADRSLSDCKTRPIIFVCHGLGGIIVKRALSYAETRRTRNTEHLHSIFVMTYAILFFGTPHDEVDITEWIAYEEAQRHRYKHLVNLPRSSQTQSLQLISDQFVPLARRFRIFNFWESFTTPGVKSGYVVSESSAAPAMDNTEKSGISANHSGMVKFSSPNSSSYRTIAEALKRYSDSAPNIVRGRYKHAMERLARDIASEISELAGSPYELTNLRKQFAPDSPVKPSSVKKVANKHFYLPRTPATEYVGRKNVFKQLEEAFFGASDPESGTSERPKQIQRRFVIYGMFGSGKTEFACKFATDHQDRFWAIFTVNGTSNSTIDASFASIGKVGGFEATASAGKHWLAEIEDPWLLIIDNADSPSLDLNSLFPSKNRGCVLITTRNAVFKSHGNVGVGSVELKGLEEPEALHLLLRKADIQAPWDESTESHGKTIVRALGYLALALIHAGTTICKKICILSEFLTFYNDLRRLRWRPRDMEDGVVENLEDAHHLYTLFDCSLKHLEESKTRYSRDAIDILNIVGFYNFSRIPVRIFTRAVENRLRSRTIIDTTKPNSFPARIVAAAIKRLEAPEHLPHFLRGDPKTLSPYRVREALSKLYSMSFISYDGKDETFSLHPLTHKWCQDRLGKDWPWERKIWAAIALNTAVESILLPPADQGENFGEFHTALIPHLDSALSAHPIEVEDFSGRTGAWKLSLAKFMMQHKLMVVRNKVISAAKCGFVYTERGKFELGATYLGKAKEALVQVLGYENEKTQSAMIGLAATCWGLGRLEEAISLQKKVVEIRTKLLGPEHHQTLFAMNHLGKSYWLHGQYREALDLQKLTLERMQSTLGNDHLDTLEAMDNYGVTLGSWQRYAESLAVHEEVLRIRVSQNKGGMPDLPTLDTMSNLAMALLDLGRLDEAKDKIEYVYKLRWMKLGKEHPYTLWALCYLSKVFIERGELEAAEHLLLEGIPAAKRSLGDGHLGVLMGCGQLARVYARTGRFVESEQLVLDTINGMSRYRGVEHPDYVYAQWKLCQLFDMQGKSKEAIAACERALAGAKWRLTLEHPLAVRIQTRLSELKNTSSEIQQRSLGEELHTYSQRGGSVSNAGYTTSSEPNDSAEYSPKLPNASPSMLGVNGTPTEATETPRPHNFLSKLRTKTW